MIAAIQTLNAVGMTFCGDMFPVANVIARTYFLHAWFRREGIGVVAELQPAAAGTLAGWRGGRVSVTA